MTARRREEGEERGKVCSHLLWRELSLVCVCVCEWVRINLIGVVMKTWQTHADITSDASSKRLELWI